MGVKRLSESKRPITESGRSTLEVTLLIDTNWPTDLQSAEVITVNNRMAVLSRRQVRNLGWLIAHKHDVVRFIVRTNIDVATNEVGDGDTLTNDAGGAMLYAHMGTGFMVDVFRVHFADESILRRFLCRPSWVGTEVQIDDIPFTITKNGIV